MSDIKLPPIKKSHKNKRKIKKITKKIEGLNTRVTDFSSSNKRRIDLLEKKINRLEVKIEKLEKIIKN